MTSFIKQPTKHMVIANLDEMTSVLSTEVPSLDKNIFDNEINGFSINEEEEDDDDLKLPIKAKTNEDKVIAIDILGIANADEDPGSDDAFQFVSFDSVSAGGASITEVNGTLVFDPTGIYDYLAVGETVTDTFTYTIGEPDDGGFEDLITKTVTVTIEGRNDRPVAENLDFSIGEDDPAFTDSFVASDIDASDILSFKILSQPVDEFGNQYGKVINNEDGTFSFDPLDDFQFLNEGQSRDVTFTYVAIDDSGAGNATSEVKTVTVTVDGSNDAPVSFDFTRTFETFDRSIWSNDTAFQFSDSRFLGFEWNKSDSVEIWPLPSLELRGATSGKVGFDSNLTIDSGSLNASLPFDIQFEVPAQIEAGQEVSISSSTILNPDAFYDVVSPNITYQLDLIFRLAASLGINDPDNIFGFNIPEQRINFVDFDSRENAEFQFDTPIPGIESFTLKAPNLDVAPGDIQVNDLSVSSQTSSDVFQANLDLDAVATKLLNLAGVPIPPLEGGVSGSFGPISYEASYNIADFTLLPTLTLNQMLELKTDGLTGQLFVENDLTNPIDFILGQDVTFIAPEGVGETLDLTVQLDVNNPELKNVTSLGLDVDFVLDLLSASVGGSIDIPFLPDPSVSIGFGPLISETIDVFNAEIADVFNEQFALGGFNQQSVAFGIDVAGVA